MPAPSIATQLKIKQLMSTIVICGGVIGTTTLAVAPSAEANEHHHHHRHYELRRIRRAFRHDVRDFHRDQRAYKRDWRHARRIYNRRVFGYPRVIPAYGYGPRVEPGFGIQIRL